MFSVVIPLYNKEQSIANTIQSVLDQTFQDFEIVVVNDGSTDKSMERVKAFEDSRIRIIDKPNGGVSSARNRGIEESRYEWIAFLDGDDLWEISFLLEMKKLILDFPDCVIYGSNYSIRMNNEEVLKKNQLDLNFRGLIPNYFQIAIKGLLYTSSSTIVNNMLVKNEILFDENLSYGEDLDYWLRVNEKGKAAFINSSLVIYNQDISNRAMNKKHDIIKNYIFHSIKYKQLEKTNKDFNKLINSIRIRKIPEIIFNSNATDIQIKYYFTLIDSTYQNWKSKLFLVLPFYFKKLIIFQIYKSQ